MAKYKNRYNVIIILMIVFAFFSFNKKVSADTGTGTSSDPYVINSISDIQPALDKGKNISSTDTLYIKLNSDISYSSSDSFKIYSNLSIDGSKNSSENYAMKYTGTSYTSGSAGYTLTKSGLSVSFNNMTFGDSSFSSNQTYYGILLGTSYQVNFYANDITYYGNNGAQPFCNYNVNTVVTLQGNNTFTSKAGNSSQEFFEGDNLIFDSNSHTNIAHNTSTGVSSLIYNSTSSSLLNITIKNNASVNIDTNKPYFTYGSAVNLNIGENSSFNFNNNTSGATFSNAYLTTINSSKNSSINITGNGLVGANSSSQTTINSTTPQSINFENNSGGTGLFKNNITLNNTDPSGYSFHYYINKVESVMDASNSSYVLNDNNIKSNLTQLKYYATPQLSFSAESNVENSPTLSQIIISNVIMTNNDLNYYQYKIYKKDIIDGDINSSTNQSLITNDQNSTYSGTGTATKTIDKVISGEYTVYVKGFSNNNGSTNWTKQTVNVKKTLLNITLPVDIKFNVIDNSQFSSSSYQFINNSNFDTTFNISNVSKLGNTDTNLVGSIVDDTPQNSIYLALKSQNATLPFDQTGQNSGTDSITGFGGINKFNIIGQYKGPISTTNSKNVSYKLSLNFN